jgi:hypothetical protein
MANGSSDEKQHAHELIDRMAPGQVAAVVSLLEIMFDPLTHTLASAPYDDEPVSDEEARDARRRSLTARAFHTKKFSLSSA